MVSEPVAERWRNTSSSVQVYLIRYLRFSNIAGTSTSVVEAS